MCTRYAVCANIYVKSDPKQQNKRENTIIQHNKTYFSCAHNAWHVLHYSCWLSCSYEWNKGMSLATDQADTEVVCHCSLVPCFNQPFMICLSHLHWFILLTPTRTLILNVPAACNLPPTTSAIVLWHWNLWCQDVFTVLMLVGNCTSES